MYVCRYTIIKYLLTWANCWMYRFTVLDEQYGSFAHLSKAVNQTKGILKNRWSNKSVTFHVGNDLKLSAIILKRARKSRNMDIYYMPIIFLLHLVQIARSVFFNSEITYNWIFYEQMVHTSHKQLWILTFKDFLCSSFQLFWNLTTRPFCLHFNI